MNVLVLSPGVSDPRQLLFVFSWNYFSLQNNDGSYLD